MTLLGDARLGSFACPTGATGMTRSEGRKDLAAVELQEPPLIVAGPVEDERTEAHVDVGLDLFDMLGRIAGDDPTAVSYTHLTLPTTPYV